MSDYVVNYNDPCPDCSVDVGHAHEDMCDVARCLWTGYQRLTCIALNLTDDTTLSAVASSIGHDCGHDIWTGDWPGDADARALGWWARFTQHGWERCGPDDDAAVPDLNRLRPPYARWDRDRKQWVAAEQAGTT